MSSGVFLTTKIACKKIGVMPVDKLEVDDFEYVEKAVIIEYPIKVLLAFL